MSCSRRQFVALGVLLTFSACQRPYQVGDYVLVEWGSEKRLYPAYIIEQKGKSRYRVTFEGYPQRWDEDVALPRIRGLVQGPALPPPPPRHVRIATGVRQKKPEDVVSRYRLGQVIRVEWRGSSYRASVIEVVSTDRIKVHYDGHEAAWDEEISISRVVTK